MANEMPVALKLVDVWFRYPFSNEWILRGVNASFDRGTINYITGVSGCGKTTLLHIIRGLNREKGGELRGKVCIRGRCISELSLYDIGHQVLLMFQDPSIQIGYFNKVIDEVRAGLMFSSIPWHECEERAWRQVSTTLSHAFAFRNPLELSGGEQQKVVLASLVASSTTEQFILLLDEPFSFLDLSGLRELKAHLCRLAEEGNTVIVTTHHLEQIDESVDKLLVMHEGKIYMQGTPPEVINDKKFAQVLDPPLSIQLSQLLGVDRIRPVARASRLPISFEHFLGKQDLLQIKNVVFDYTGNRHALDHISLEVNQGDIVGLIGPNGCGKTTLLKVVMGILKPKEGKITVAGKDITRLSPFKRAGHIGYVSQNPDDMIFGETVMDECSFGPFSLRIPYPEKVIDETLRRLGLQDYVTKDPLQLSGGMKRLLNIASVLVNGPRLLLLDEPEYGLDTRSWRVVERSLNILRKNGVTIILATHVPETVFLICDKVAVINNGRIIAVDTPLNIFSNEALCEKSGISQPKGFKLLRELGIQESEWRPICNKIRSNYL